MAQLHIDFRYDTKMGDIVEAANAETLTNQVRIIYNDDFADDQGPGNPSNKKDQVILAIRRGSERLIEILSAKASS